MIQPLSDPNLGSPLGKTIHTDGSCYALTRVGGWAWVCLADDRVGCGNATDTTNQRMEITAAYEAVRANDGPLFIISDSMYVVRCFDQGWFHKWHHNGWMTQAKTEVKNRDLWEPFIDLVIQRGDVRFTWVKGHSGDPGNERADQLASLAARAPIEC